MTDAQKAKYPNWEELTETLNSVTVIIERKGTYSIWLPDGRVSGNVRVEGDIATFTPEKINGRPLAEVRATLSNNVPLADLRQALQTLDEISEAESMRIGKGDKVLEWVEASNDLTHWLEKLN